MKKNITTITAILLLSAMLFAMSACSGKNEPTTAYSGYTYVPSSDSAYESTTAADYTQNIDVDTSWQSNFNVSYKYYNPEQYGEELEITEKKSDTAFTVTDITNKTTMYYKKNGSDVDNYVIVEGNKKQAHSLIKNQTIENLSSMFMKLTGVSEDLPSQNNVLYMYDETVAGRICHKYIQRAYQNSSLTESVYVWIDVQYGFAAKCESYDSSDKLTVSWEAVSFETGKLTDKDVTLDISGYTFVEE